MTEKQWLTGSAPLALYRQVAGRLSRQRLLRLGLALYGRPEPGSRVERAAFAVLERYVEGQADDAALRTARKRLLDADQDDGCDTDLLCLLSLELDEGIANIIRLQKGPKQEGVRRQFCETIREIAGNPFRPWKAIPEAMGGGLVQPDGATVFPSSVARAVAAGIAADQAFDRLPVLADALEDSGVTDAELLAHCRRPGGHLRGCWAVDVVLGKS